VRRPLAGRPGDWHGFSLVELLLVLAVLGVIMAAVVPAARGGHESGKFQATLKTATGLAEAVRQYRMATGAWPARWSDLGGRYLATPAPTTAWGAPFTLTSTSGSAVITTTVPLHSAPNGLLPPVASLTAIAGGSQLTVGVAIPEEAADLVWERNRVSGSTGF